MRNEATTVEQYFTFEEAAALTRTSSGWWRRRVAAGEITSTKIGGVVRIPAREVRRVIAEGERPIVRRSGRG